jgi:hypothetical protein
MDSILQSKLWKHLETRIERIERPEWFNDKFGTAVKEFENVVESKTSALAQKVIRVGANLNNNLAMVNQEITTLVTTTQSQATSITTLATQFNNNVSYVQQSLTSLTNAQSSQASTITTLQTDVGAASASAQQAFTLAQTVDGEIDAAWSVKVDANGYVAGFGFGVDGKAGAVTSDFYVRADRFAVGSPGAVKSVPFFIQGGKTYIENLMLTGLPLQTGSASMTGGATGDITITHNKGKFVIPVVAWNSPPALSHSIIITYIDQNSFRFRMHAENSGAYYTGTVNYALTYI